MLKQGLREILSDMGYLDPKDQDLEIKVTDDGKGTVNVQCIKWEGRFDY